MSRHTPVRVRWSRLILAVIVMAVLSATAGAARRPRSALDEVQRGGGPPDVEVLVLRFAHIPAESFVDTLEQLGENEEFGRALEQVPRALNEPANAVVLVVPPEVADAVRRMADRIDQPNEFAIHQQEREAEAAAVRAEMEERERAFDRDQAEFDLEMDRRRLELEKAEAEARLRLEAAKRPLARPPTPPPPPPMDTRRRGPRCEPECRCPNRGTPRCRDAGAPCPPGCRCPHHGPPRKAFRRGGGPKLMPGPRAERPPQPRRLERERGPRPLQPERLRRPHRDRPGPREAEEREHRREAEEREHRREADEREARREAEEREHRREADEREARRRDIDRRRERIHRELRELERHEAEIRREHENDVRREAGGIEERLREVRGRLEGLEQKKRDLRAKGEHLRGEDLPPEKREHLQGRLEGALRELQEHQGRMHRELEELREGRQRLQQRAHESLQEHLEGIESRHRQLRRQLEKLGEREGRAPEAPPEARRRRREPEPDRPPEGPGRGGLPEWLLGPRAREALGLSEDQAERVRDLLRDLREHRERLMRDLRDKLRDAGPEGRREMLRHMKERFAEARSEMMRRVRGRLMEILRPEQRETLERGFRPDGEPADEPRREEPRRDEPERGRPHERHRHDQPAGRQGGPLHRLIQDVVIIGGGKGDGAVGAVIEGTPAEDGAVGVAVGGDAQTQGIQVFVNGEPVQVEVQDRPVEVEGGPGRVRRRGRRGQADDPERQERIRRMRVRYLFNMLQDEDLRAEVDLAPRQEQTIAKLIKEYQEERKRIEHDVRSQIGPPDAEGADPGALERRRRRETAAAMRDAEPMLALIAQEAVDVLTDEQKERLQEASRERARLRMACGDLWVLTTKRAIEELGLDAGQRLRIRAILDDATKSLHQRYQQVRESFREVPPEARRGEAMRRRWQNLRKAREEGLTDIRERLFKVLTPPQREKVEAFLAESKAKAGWQGGRNRAQPGNRRGDSRGEGAERAPNLL